MTDQILEDTIEENDDSDANKSVEESSMVAEGSDAKNVVEENNANEEDTSDLDDVEDQMEDEKNQESTDEDNRKEDSDNEESEDSKSNDDDDDEGDDDEGDDDDDEGDDDDDDDEGDDDNDSDDDGDDDDDEGDDDDDDDDDEGDDDNDGDDEGDDDDDAGDDDDDEGDDDDDAGDDDDDSDKDSTTAAEITGDEEGVVVIGPKSTPTAKWYVVHTYAGHEKKVAITLKQRAESGGYLDRIFKVFIPQQQKIVISEGKKRSVNERLFPGYVIVQMDMSDDAWLLVRSTRGVTGFVGMGSTPTPLPEQEVATLMKFATMEAPKFEAKFTIGDSVKIMEGPFRDFLGKVDEVNDDQGKVKVLVNVFGRETPVELDFVQVQSL